MNRQDFLDISEETERLKWLIGCAIAAPSSHNTQPWEFRASGRTIELWGDKERALPASDPAHRQFFISLGCALENLLTAADGFALSFDLEMFPNGPAEMCVARLVFQDLSPRPEAGAHPMDAIFSRHANRSKYEPKELPEEFAAKVRALARPEMKVDLVTDERRAQMVDILGRATEAAFQDKKFTEELSHWIKPSLRKYRDGMPGYNIGVPWPVSFLMPLAIRYADLSKKQRVMVEEPARTASAILVISTLEDGPAAWVAAGRTLEQIWLMATMDGLKMISMAAAIEIGGFYKEIQAVLKGAERPQVFARIGYSNQIPERSPRRPLEEVLTFIK